MTLSSLFLIIASMSFTGSVAAAIILLAKTVMKNRLGAAWHYVIWALLLIRLTVPALPQSACSVFSLLENPSPAVSEAWEGTGVRLPAAGEYPAHSGAAVSDTLRPGTGADVLGLVWLIGAAAMLLYALGVNAVFLLRLRRMPRCADARVTAILDACSATLHIRRKPALVYDADRRIPVLYGLIRPRILVDPWVLAGLSDNELRHIFLHELTHIKRLDILANWATVVVRAVHWFNPVVWYAASRMRQDQEVACDAYVLAYLRPDEHKKYGETIIRLLKSLSARGHAPVAVGMAGNDKSTIKRRITMIKMFRKPSFRWTAVAVAVMLVIGVVVLTDSPANAKGDEDPNVTLPREEQTPAETPAESAAPGATPDPTPAVPWQVPVSYDLTAVKNDQASVDQGHSPWQLSPVMVAQVFVSLQVSPDGIVGEYPVSEDDITIVSQSGSEAVLDIGGDVTPVRTVYLQRLVTQDDTGIWTVVGYDPAEK